jgi:hypothetical protein
MATDTTINSRLPEDCFLAYVVSHEAWYSEVIDGRRVSICAEARGGGVAWEFLAVEKDVGGEPTVRLEFFSDAFDAFFQVPELFNAIGEHGPIGRLEDLVGVLDQVGAKDITERTRPVGR